MTTSFERRAAVDAPLDAVAATLADFAGLDRWAGAVDHTSALTDPPTGLGASRRVQVGRRAVVEHVVEWDLPATLAYRIDGLPPALGEVVNRWHLTASGNRTTVTLTSTVDAGPRPVGRLVERIAGRILTRTSDRLLADLAAHHAHDADPAAAARPGSHR